MSAEPFDPNRGAALWIDPARLGGTVAMTGTRLGAEWAADYVWAGMLDELRQGWDYVSDRQILVACWWVATHGTRKWRKRWGSWADDAFMALASRRGPLPDFPPANPEPSP